MGGLPITDSWPSSPLTDSHIDQKQATSAVGSDLKPKKKICCACPDTKRLRDECIVEHGEDSCSKWIEAHLKCLRAEGFKDKFNDAAEDRLAESNDNIAKYPDQIRASIPAVEAEDSTQNLRNLSGARLGSNEVNSGRDVEADDARGGKCGNPKPLLVYTTGRRRDNGPGSLNTTQTPQPSPTNLAANEEKSVVLGVKPICEDREGETEILMKCNCSEPLVLGQKRVSVDHKILRSTFELDSQGCKFSFVYSRRKKEETTTTSPIHISTGDCKVFDEMSEDKLGPKTIERSAHKMFNETPQSTKKNFNQGVEVSTQPSEIGEQCLGNPTQNLSKDKQLSVLKHNHNKLDTKSIHAWRGIVEQKWGYEVPKAKEQH